MPTKLIEFDNGVLVEVEADGNQSRQISWRLAEKISQASFDSVRNLLVKVCQPIADAFSEVSSDVDIEGAEVEFGVCFEGEGSVYITKVKTAANLKIKMIVKPKKN